MPPTQRTGGRKWNDRWVDQGQGQGFRQRNRFLVERRSLGCLREPEALEPMEEVRSDLLGWIYLLQCARGITRNRLHGFGWCNGWSQFDRCCQYDSVPHGTWAVCIWVHVLTLFEQIFLCKSCGTLSHQSGPTTTASVRGFGREKYRCMGPFRNMVHAGIYLYNCGYYGEGPPFQVCTANITS